ncbi:MAG: ThuA domain-containing protein [Trueperaceae bacterium]|nr:ThuA domain-containing protein [Trueperaceae bacterium]
MTNEAIKLAVITGGHSFNVPEFRHLFERLEGVKAYIQHLDDFATASKEIRESYDALLFYIMMMDGPSDDEPGFRGKPKTVLEQLGNSAQGIIVMHHGLLAYPDWSLWNDLVGIENRNLQSYEHDIGLNIKVVNPDHPITRGLSDWHMVDETYELQDPLPSVNTLLSVSAPKSMQTLAWTHSFKQSCVFCLQLGHDQRAWQNPHFQALLGNGIHWTCHP